MACFIVPAAEAIVTTVVTKVVKNKEKKSLESTEHVTVEEGKIPFSKKLSWLNYMLWGGSGLLAFEHVWHGEVVPWFPFLTAMSSPESTLDMLREMASHGTLMAGLVTAVWIGMVAVSSVLSTKKEPAKEEVTE